MLLTAVVPEPATGSVTARGEALPGQPDPWAVVAVAICGRLPAYREVVSAELTPTCPGGTLPTGTGFELPGPPGAVLLTGGVVPDLSEGSVTVRAAGPGPAAYPPGAYAICLEAGALGTRRRRSADLARIGGVRTELSFGHRRCSSRAAST